MKQLPVVDLRGAWSRRISEPGGSRPQDTIRPNRASRAENCRFDGGVVMGRDGFIAGPAAAGAVTTIFQWILPTLDFIVTFENGKVVFRSGTGDTEGPAFAGAYSFAAAEVGDKVYLAFYNVQCVATTEARIALPSYPGVPLDKAFMGPMSIVPTAAEAGAGLCTVGAHLLGYVVESRSGSLSRMSPIAGGTFTPISFTVSVDKTIRLSINATWPDDARFVRACMTTKENPAQFFLVPDLKVEVSGGATLTVQLDISIADEDLARATDMTDGESKLTQVGGSGPIQPFNIKALGTRMAYFTGAGVYISDPYDFEYVTGDQHLLQVPMQRYLVTACQIRGVNYLFGPKWTYGWVDRRDATPSEWSDPDTTSDSQGTSAIYGVEMSTTGDFAWVANEDGFWNFGGRFAEFPISYMQESTWKRINWFYGRATLRIVDNPGAYVRVFAPLDGATQNSHVLTWYYSRGKSPQDVDFSLDQISGGASIGGAAMVMDRLTRKSELWVGPMVAGSILKERREAMDDAGVAIPAVWESGRLFGPTRFLDMHFHRVIADVRGFGNLVARMWDAGRKESVLLDLTQENEQPLLEELPTDPMDLPGYLKSPDATIEFGTTQASERMYVSGFMVNYEPAGGK